MQNKIVFLCLRNECAFRWIIIRNLCHLMYAVSIGICISDHCWPNAHDKLTKSDIRSNWSQFEHKNQKCEL